MRTSAASPAPGATVPGTGVDAELVRRVTRPDFDDWMRHISGASGCSNPIRLAGFSTQVEESTGRIVREIDTAAMPDGVIYKACGNRRASVCPHCAEIYRADTYQLVMAGLTGGKGVPASVSKHPCVLLTTTAPSFGPVHTHHLDLLGKPAPCHPRRNPETCPHGVVLDCRARHEQDDKLVGRPLCLDCCDAAYQAVWNAWAGELWRRTTIAANRLLEALEAKHECRLRLSYAKVAEFQHRGVAHFHALVRLDAYDPLDPETVLEPPETIRPRYLETLLLEAARRVSYTTPPHPQRPEGWRLTWGKQVDTRTVVLTVRDIDKNGEVSERAVAGYLAKYATKSTEAAGHVSGRLTESTVDWYANPNTLAGRMIRACWDLGRRPDDADPDEWAKTYARLRRWAHCLGFGSHFSTKSRRYSTTLGALRRARRDWVTDHAPTGPTEPELSEDETTLVVGALSFAGIGWHTTADAMLANTAAARAREYRATAREELSTLQTL